VQLTTGASAQNAARQVRSARDDAYPLNPATIRVNGIAVYEGWTNNGPGASHLLTWVEPSADNVEVELDTASRPGAALDGAALKRQGIAVATGLAGHIGH